MHSAAILITPIGDMDPKLVDAVCRGVHQAFGLPSVSFSLLSDISFALDPARGQYHSTRILEKLAELAPPETLRVLGITDVDLFIPILTYVFGEAQLNGRSAVISLHRLDDGPLYADAGDRLHARAVKEAIHELGHTLNLRHCKEKSCIMHYCRSIGDVDGKSDQLCRYCRILLQDALKRESQEK